MLFVDTLHGKDALDSRDEVLGDKPEAYLVFSVRYMHATVIERWQQHRHCFRKFNKMMPQVVSIFQLFSYLCSCGT